MEWDQILSKYAGQPIKLWIEDRSGEEQTKPKPYSLFKVALTDDRKGLQFYLNAAQFLSIPIFDESLTKLEKSATGEHFVSHDLEAKLIYWVYFEDSK